LARNSVSEQTFRFLMPNSTLSPLILGFGKLDLNEKIIHGSNAKPGDHPWMVYIEVGSGSYCGGFLVDQQDVITAAHCVFDGHRPLEPVNFQVYVGAYNLDSLDTPYEVEKIHYLPDYNSSAFDYDIAVLKLRYNVTYSSKVSPICLAEEELKPHENLIAAGFGRTSSEPSPPSKILQQVGVEYIPRKIFLHSIISQVPLERNQALVNQLALSLSL